MRPKRSSSPSPAYLGSSYRFRQALARPPARSRFWLGAPTTRLRKARSCRREGGRPGRKRRFPRAASRENGGGALWSRIAISAVLVARTLGDLVGCPLTAPISGWTRPSITRGRPPRARGRRPLRARDGRRRGPGGRCRGRPGGPAARQLPSGRQASAERTSDCVGDGLRCRLPSIEKVPTARDESVYAPEVECRRPPGMLHDSPIPTPFHVKHPPPLLADVGPSALVSHDSRHAPRTTGRRWRPVACRRPRGQTESPGAADTRDCSRRA